MEKLTPYQRRLFVFLGVATFFEGYDFLALTQILPNLRAEMDLAPSHGGYLVAAINFGTMVAYLLVRKADQWGRRRLLMLTISGYTIFTFLTGLSPNVVAFAACQLLARIFLIAEWATSVVYAAEEFPAERRGMVIGVIQATSSLGSIVCAGVVPLLLATDYGWRAVYFVGITPLIILAFARRNIKESHRFAEQVAERRSAARHSDFFRIFSSPYRGRMLQLALIWALSYVCIQNGITFWKEFAVAERGMSDADVASLVTYAAVGAMPFVFFAGKMLDVLGRKGGGAIIFLITSFGVYAAYTFETPAALTFALAMGIFGSSAILPVLNAYTAELFPTDLRGDAFAWSNNILGRTTYVLSPLAIGWAAESVGWGVAVSATAVFPLVALGYLLLKLPETRGLELEETAKLHGAEAAITAPASAAAGA
ncbi:MAG: MFS transporter [Candidatus Schekmanbacteria bacterium]|nr:MFS transporter [Candidatus Schekmanbacteria bacterium]